MSVMSKYSSFFLLGSAQYETLGDKLRLRKYGSWLAEEAWLREEESQKRAHFTLKAIDLAKRIAADKGISEDEAFQSLSGNLAEGGNFYGQYAQEVSALMASLPSGREQFEKLVTVFFKNRGEVMVGKKWEATTEWTEEDTRMLPKALLEQVEAFMVKEEQGSQEEKEGDETEATEEEEAKN